MYIVLLDLVLNLVFQYTSNSTILYYTVYCISRNNKTKYFRTLGVGTNERAARGHENALKNEGPSKF